MLLSLLVLRCVCASFPSGFEVCMCFFPFWFGGVWGVNLIVLVLEHCLSFYSTCER